MTAEVIQFVPRPNPKCQENLEQMAAEIFNAALPVWPYTETNSYTAPDGDCA